MASSSGLAGLPIDERTRSLKCGTRLPIGIQIPEQSRAEAKANEHCLLGDGSMTSVPNELTVPRVNFVGRKSARSTATGRKRLSTDHIATVPQANND